MRVCMVMSVRQIVPRVIRLITRRYGVNKSIFVSAGRGNCSCEVRSPPTVNGCNLVTSVIKSVLGRNGSCTLRGQGVHMPFVVSLLSCLSRFLVQKIQFAAPMYFESHWISGDVYDAFKHSHVRVARSRFRSHHKPMFML